MARSTVDFIEGAWQATTGQVSIASTATQIVAARSPRRSVLVINHGTTDVYIGFTSGVTTATGILLTGTKGASLSIPSNTTIYGITASGTQTISYAEVY